MTMLGADTGQLTDLATEFGEAADELDALARRLSQSIGRTDSWQGPSATRCKEEWTGLAQDNMRQVADQLTWAGRHLRVHAIAQDIASGDTHLVTLFNRLYDAAITGSAAYKIYSAWKSGQRLAAFFQALNLPSRGFAALARFEKLLEAGRAFVNGTSASPFFRMLGRISLYTTAATAAWQVYSGGGYENQARAWATRGFALAGAAGAGTLIAAGFGVAFAPITLGVAAVGVAAYSAWSLGNYIYDNRDAIGRTISIGASWVADRFNDVTSAARGNALTNGRAMLAAGGV